MLPSILASTDAAPGEVTVIVLLCLLPFVLVMSAFFSGSETALFSLDASQRQQMRRTGRGGAKAALSLLQQPRMLLITLLLGNMTANVLYFVISSVLLMWMAPGWLAKFALAIGSLLIIVLLGEVLPKMAAAASPRRFSSFIAPIMLTIHRAIVPLRVVVDVAIVTPISRLTGVSRSSDGLTADELERLLALSSASGVVDRDEQQTLSDVMQLGRTTVRRAMTPRTRMVTIQAEDSPDQVRKLIERHHFTRLPVHGEDLDDIVGVLPVKDWLRRGPEAPIAESLVPATFVPEVATLERALEMFRENAIVFAVVVDEYGGTSGVIALQDIVEEIIGDIAEPMGVTSKPPRPLGPGQWIVDGDTSVRHLRDALGRLGSETHAATLGGFITARLGRLPEAGDRIEMDDLLLEVHHAEQGHVTTVLVSLRQHGGEA